MPTSRPDWIAGATGLVGRALCAELPEGLALVRKPTPGLPVPTALVDYGRPESFAALPAPGRVFIALGTTMAQAGSREAFRAVDFDAVLAVARAARAAGATHCGLVSALRADANATVFYSRVKGEAEDALKALGFERLVIARPSLLDGEREALDQPHRSGEALSLRLMRPLGSLIPVTWRPISAKRVAHALCMTLGAPGPAVQIVESGELQRLGA